MKLLSKGHSVVARAASTDETRFMLNGVYLEETDKGIRAVATDGRILAIVEDESGALPASEYPCGVIPKDADDSAKSAIVPTKAYRRAFKSIPKRARFPALERVAVALGAETTTLGVTDLRAPVVSTVVNIEGPYPPFGSVVPTGKPKPSITTAFNPALFMRACQMASEFGLERMTLEFTAALDPVKITGSRNGQTLTVVVMPMSL